MYSTALWLVVALEFGAIGCRFKEGGGEVRRTSIEPTQAPMGEIHLTLEQVRLNQILTITTSEDWVMPTLTAIGRVTPRAGGEAQVFSPFAGRVIVDPSALPQVGTRVERDQVLAEVEQLVSASEKLQITTAATQLEASIQQAEREVAFRQTELSRAQQLYEGGAFALKQVQAADLNLNQARIQLETARLAKAQYEQAVVPNAVPRREFIRAPISGTIVATDLVSGAQIDPTRRLMTLVDLNTVWVEVAVHESEWPSIGQPARTARIKVRAIPGHIFTGRLITIGNLEDPSNRTVTVTYSVDNPGASLKIGMYAEAQIPVGIRVKALIIPSSAVIVEANQSIVFVESGPGIFVRRVVELGDAVGDSIVVKSGLRLGEKLVRRGAQILQAETSRSQIPKEGD